MRRVGAEAVGTALLVATVVGSGIMGERLSGGNDALALLGNTIATGAMLVVLVLGLGPVSGAHFNPVVTLVMARRRELPWPGAAAYIAAQVAGGIAGTILAHAMFDLPLLQAGVKARWGAGQWLAEAVAAFGLIGTILSVARARPESLPWAVGLYITAGYWFTASTSFANPAVTIARALTDSFSGIDPAHVLPFALAQVTGALAGAAAFGWMIGPARQDP